MLTKKTSLLLCLLLTGMLFIKGSRSQPQTDPPGYAYGYLPRIFSYEEDSLFFRHYPFCDLDNNLISDQKGTLQPFFEKLFALEQYLPAEEGPFTVSIAHIGDSHIQGGFLTEPLRKAFHNDFGNAGRGLIMPLKLARTNQPDDYAIVSANRWSGASAIQPDRSCEIGLGGIGITTDSPVVHFELSVFSADGEDNSFNAVTVFHHKLAPLLFVPDSLSLDFSCPDPSDAAVTRLDLTTPVERIVLTGDAGNKPYTNATFYGFNLTNGKSGVLYHSIGVNGACFAHHARNEELFDQLPRLEPALYIVSLGTNEAAVRNFSPEYFHAEVDRLITNLRRTSPDAVIIITTPAENFRRTRKGYYEPNPAIEKATDILVGYAQSHGLAYWDLFRITGGSGSCRAWQSMNLFRRDGVHYTREGYELHGKLLYNALIKEYKKYLSAMTGKAKTSGSFRNISLFPALPSGLLNPFDGENHRKTTQANF